MQEELRARRAVDGASVTPSSSNDEGGAELGELRKMVDRRVKGEPLQYILGNQPFGPITIKTRAPTLIPRPETEDWTIRLVSVLEERLPTGGREKNVIRMLDLCTGTGCIPILLSHLRRQSGGITVAYGVDISTEALALARENATDHSLTPSSGLDYNTAHNEDPGEKTEVGETGDGTQRSSDSLVDVIYADILGENFVQDVLSRMKPPFDVITSNPPYVPMDEYDGLSKSVREWEDPRAILGDLPTHNSEGNSSKGRGLTFYRRIAQIVSTDGVLGPNGMVLLEVGDGQAEEVREILDESGGVSRTEVWKDPRGIPRVVVGYR